MVNITECYLFYRWFNADPSLLKCSKLSAQRISQTKKYIELLKSKGNVNFDNSTSDIERFRTIQKQIPEYQIYRQNSVNTENSKTVTVQPQTPSCQIPQAQTPKPTDTDRKIFDLIKLAREIQYDTQTENRIAFYEYQRGKSTKQEQKESLKQFSKVNKNNPHCWMCIVSLSEPNIVSVKCIEDCIKCSSHCQNFGKYTEEAKLSKSPQPT